jgi:AraC family transcriptional activator of tynA and feaB
MLHFLSAALPPPERAAAYRQALLRYFAYLGPDARAEVETDEPDHFSASLEEFAIGRLSGGIHRCNATHRLFLPPTGARTLELYLLCSGGLTLAGNEGAVDLTPGDMVLWRMGRECQATSRGFELIGFGLPESFVLDRDLELAGAIGRRIAGTSGLAASVAAFLRKMAESHRELTCEEGTALQDAALDTICLLSRSDSVRGLPAAPAEEAEKLKRLKGLAMRCLERADLTPAALAARCGISTRTVHRLFAASGTTFQDWLRERRLERCWVELSDRSRNGRSIADVAFGCGFNDLSTFNRAFRARFGVTPRVARRHRQTGTL